MRVHVISGLRIFYLLLFNLRWSFDEKTSPKKPPQYDIIVRRYIYVHHPLIGNISWEFHIYIPTKNQPDYHNKIISVIITPFKLLSLQSCCCCCCCVNILPFTSHVQVVFGPQNIRDAPLSHPTCIYEIH